MKNLTIIIPVYRGLEETQECILSVVDNLPNWAELLVINDCSPEEELTEWLRNNSNEKNYSLYENEKNLGFVETVNKGMKLASPNDVLLLNSDVEAAESDWLERMRNAAYSRSKVASITPFSNNATICSFPNFCEDNELADSLNVTELDNVFSSIELEDDLVEIPTGVGFCMYIKRDCLDEVGYFDHETFGKGYGEENDWCQRALKAGWVNYHQLNVFAYHKGGVSFAEEGDPRKAKALELLLGLHPNYDVDVQKFIASDPAGKARIAAMLEIVKRSQKKKILLVSHGLGGGVDQHLEELIDYYSDDAIFFKLETKENGLRVLFSNTVFGKQSIEFSIPQDYEVLVALLLYIGVERVHYHHTMGIPEKIFGLSNDLGVDYDITVHDYYYVNGNPTLTNSNGVFVGDDNSKRDISCSDRYPISVTAEEWRKANEPFLRNAQRVIYPSLDVANRYNSIFQTISDNSVVAYHLDSLVNHDDVFANIAVAQKKPVKVLVLGAISPEKGADLLEATAGVSELEFHLLGYAYRPLENVVTHGPYSTEDVDKLIESIAPDYIWFPAQCPETYSYTLSIALKHNATIVCPDIGAFPERVYNREGSIICPWNMPVERYSEFWSLLISGQDLSKFSLSKKPVESKFFLQKDFYTKYYLDYQSSRRQVSTNIKANEIVEMIYISEVEEGTNRKEKLLALMWKLRNNRIVSKVSKYIPVKYQRYVKRKLSSKPIHKIIK